MSTNLKNFFGLILIFIGVFFILYGLVLFWEIQIGPIPGPYNFSDAFNAILFIPASFVVGMTLSFIGFLLFRNKSNKFLYTLTFVVLIGVVALLIYTLAA